MPKSKKYGFYCLLLILINLLLLSCKKNVSEPTSIPENLSGQTSTQLNSEGLKYHREKKYQQSLEYFAYATLKDPSNFAAYFNKACAHSLLNNGDASIDSLKKALSINPEWVYKNLNDPELDNIRNRKEFTELSSIKESLVGKWSPLECLEKFSGKYNIITRGEEVTFQADGKLIRDIKAGPNFFGDWVLAGNKLTMHMNQVTADDMSGNLEKIDEKHEYTIEYPETGIIALSSEKEKVYYCRVTVNN